LPVLDSGKIGSLAIISQEVAKYFTREHNNTFKDKSKVWCDIGNGIKANLLLSLMVKQF